MILQSLVSYYRFKQASEPGLLPEFGWGSARIASVLHLGDDGSLERVEVMPKGTVRRVPEQPVRAGSGCNPFFLCDSATYILGCDLKGKPERALRCHAASVAYHSELLEGVDSPAAAAVLRFMRGWDPSRGLEVLGALVDEGDLDRVLTGMAEFSYRGARVSDDPVVRAAWDAYRSTHSDNPVGVCLVTGERGPIARVHPHVKGVRGALSTGPALVSFNRPGFTSYGRDRDQGLNAPVGERAAFEYGAALNYLLSDPSHVATFADTTVVFWAEADDSACSTVFSALVGGRVPDAAPAPDEVVATVVGRVRRGLPPIDGVDPGAPFCVLGLAPNAGRIAVRFFHRGTFGDVVGNLAAHYSRIELAPTGREGERRFPTPYMVLQELENPRASGSAASPRLAGALLRSMLLDTPYPEELLALAVSRVRLASDDPDKRSYKVSRGRVAIIRAFLIKNRNNGDEEVVSMGLDPSRTDAPYLLGRLFSELEGIQQAAVPNARAGIKARYFNAACATPAVAFPVICKLAGAHLDKVRRESPRLARYLSMRMEDLLDGIGGFPAALSLEEQGAFILGYSHQTRDRFTKRSGDGGDQAAEQPETEDQIGGQAAGETKED